MQRPHPELPPSHTWFEAREPASPVSQGPGHHLEDVLRLLELPVQQLHVPDQRRPREPVRAPWGKNTSEKIPETGTIFRERNTKKGTQTGKK